MTNTFTNTGTTRTFKNRVTRSCLLGCCAVALMASTAAATPNNGFTALVAKKAQLDQAQAQRAVQGVFAALSEELKAGREVKIDDFGRFATASRTPKTLPGKPAAKPTRSARFTAAEGLKSSLNAQ